MLVTAVELFTVSRANRDRLVELAGKHRLPAMFSLSETAETGGLISYGADPVDGYRQVGIYVGRILKGENPGELPIMQPTKFTLAINLKTAKALGITVPPTLLALADDAAEFRFIARSGRRAPNRGDVVEDQLWDRIADDGNPVCQGQGAT